MTIPGGGTANIASSGATVGVQVGAVHGNVTNFQLRDDSAEEKYRVGAAYLDSGMPAEARDLIGRARAEGFENSEVLFHWILALLSGRSFRQFTDEDSSSFREARKLIPLYTGDRWSDGLKVINNLLVAAENPRADMRLVIRELDELEVVPRAKIVSHLEMFLVGPIEDQIWERALAQAEARRLGRDRKDRAWMFFEPDPAEPRVRPSAPVRISAAIWAGVAITSPVAAAAAGYLGWLLLARSEVLEFLAYLVNIGAGYFCCFLKGAEWRHNVERLDAKERERQPRARWSSAPADGFADIVDRLFSWCFTELRPDSVKKEEWKAATAGIRRYLRDEIVEIYREQEVGAFEVSWLIRYLVRDVAKRWQADTLWDYRDQLQTPTATKLVFVLGLALLLPGSVWAIVGAVPANPPLAIFATVILAVSGFVGGIGWLRIVLERKRHRADCEEEQQRLANSRADYAQWKEILKLTPSDSEMATWLDSDRKCLMSEAMRHYKLVASQIIAHAFIEAPAQHCVRARDHRGPWRYSQYQLIVFLLTSDGVRQLSAIVDFSEAKFHDRKRLNYRFDAVASVQITETEQHERIFELTLVNGNPIGATVMGASTEDTGKLRQGEEPDILSRLTLDAAGLTNTLHVLEGVAAEGKGWIRHQYQRQKKWER